MWIELSSQKFNSYDDEDDGADDEDDDDHNDENNANANNIKTSPTVQQAANYYTYSCIMYTLVYHKTWVIHLEFHAWAET